MFNVKFSGIDLNRFSINPPPVIWAADFIRLFFDNLIISLV